MENKKRVGLIGVGGAGIKIANGVIASENTGLYKVIAIDSDRTTLCKSNADSRVQIGSGLTHGFGAGSDPDIGYDCADEDSDTLSDLIKGYDGLFIVAGMGGGIGSGATVRLVRIARALGILTVVFAITPFEFEGNGRKENADRAIAALRESADGMVVLHNQMAVKLNKNSQSRGEGESGSNACEFVDNAAVQYINAFTDIMFRNGVLNIGFDDFATILRGGGSTYVGTGQACGEKCAFEALKKSVCGGYCDMSIEGARRIALLVESRELIDISEAEYLLSLVKKISVEDVYLAFAYAVESALPDDIRITVIATAYDQ